jgi:hypothetical protein
MTTTAKRDLAEWDREIEADFQRYAAADRAVSKHQHKHKKVEPYVKVPVWWIRAATEATHTKKALVAIELLRASSFAPGTAFALPSGRLKRFGVSRPTWWRALQDLQRAGLITIELRGRKAPLISFPVAP